MVKIQRRNEENTFFLRSKLRWAKGSSMVPRGGSRDSNVDTTAFVTKKGSLRIKRLQSKDAGLYTCLGEEESYVKVLERI